MDGKAAALTILHTNDLHSHFEAAARISRMAASLRAKVPRERLLIVDCGDHVDRMRLETEGTDGRANRAVLEWTGYDAVTLGNNEGLTLTREQMERLYADAPFAVVCANLFEADTGRRPSWMKPSHVLEKGGVRIGLVGLTAAFANYYSLLGWHAADPLEIAADVIPDLRKKADLVIVLSHLGLRYDEVLAVRVPGIDLILGGHTHHLLEQPVRVGDTTIGAAGKYGDYAGIVECRRVPGRRFRLSGGCEPTDAQPEDPELTRLLEGLRREAAAAMNRPVAALRDPLPSRPDAESPLATLLAAEIRRVTGSEIGLVNAGQLLGGLPAGTVTKLDIHAVCPSPINACRIRLKGGLIRRALEESLLPEFTEQEIRGFGFRGKVLGTLCFDGMEAAADLSRPPYERLVSVTVGGKPLADDREYAVGTLDMFTFGGGYVGIRGGGGERDFLPDFIRDLLARALGDERAVEDCRKPRWRLA